MRILKGIGASIWPSLTVRAFLVTGFFLLSACGGGGAKVESINTTTTTGQELMDLDASCKQGLLTEDEYNKARKNIMDRYDQ